MALRIVIGSVTALALESIVTPDKVPHDVSATLKLTSYFPGCRPNESAPLLSVISEATIQHTQSSCLHSQQPLGQTLPVGHSPQLQPILRTMTVMLPRTS